MQECILEFWRGKQWNWLQSSKLELLCKGGFKTCLGLESDSENLPDICSHLSKKQAQFQKMPTIENDYNIEGTTQLSVWPFWFTAPWLQEQWVYLSGVTIILWTDTCSKYLLSSRHCLDGGVSNLRWLPWRNTQIGINPPHPQVCAIDVVIDVPNSHIGQHGFLSQSCHLLLWFLTY